MNKKVIVAHPAQQHSYRLATALKKEGILYKYVTTVYGKDSSILMKFIKIFLGNENKKRANGRKCLYINDSEVKQFYELRGFFELLLMRININLYLLWSNKTTIKFAKKVAKYAIKESVDAVIMYDTKAAYGFKYLKKKNPNIKRIIDMSAPNLLYMNDIFKKDISKFGDYDNLECDFKNKSYKKLLKISEEELKLADYFLVASQFTKKSLIKYGISDDKILICPYGIDKVRDYNERLYNMDKSKLNLLFVGRATQKKGFYYFLEAIIKLDLNKFNVTIVGNYDSNSEYYLKYKESYNFTGFLTNDEVIKHCLKSDVLIFPSLADGFGLSALEGLACGLPVICSKNAGVSDIIEDGYNGFKVNAGNSVEIYEKINWFYSNKDKLIEMKNNARESVKDYTWESYNQCIANILKKIKLL